MSSFVRFEHRKCLIKLDPGDKKLIKDLTPIHFLYSKKENPLHWVPAVPSILNKLLRYIPDSRIEEYAATITSELDYKAMISRKPDVYPGLYSHQASILPVLRTHRVFGLFWDPRVGKTAPACVYASEYKKVVILTKSSQQYKWQYELEKYAGMNSIIAYGKKEARMNKYLEFTTAESSVLIISHDTAGDDFTNLNDFINVASDLLIVDEAHYLKNYESLKSKGTGTLRKSAKRVLILTGTPAMNRQHDVLQLLNFLDNSLFPFDLIRYFFETKPNRFSKLGDIGNLKPELKNSFDELLNIYGDRLTLNQVHDSSNEIIREVEYAEMHREQKNLYEDISANVAVDIDQEISFDNKLALLTRLHQTCADPRLVAEFEQSSAKNQKLFEILEEIGSEESVVIFSKFTSHLKLLQNDIPHAVLLTGETPQAQRHKLIDEFNNSKFKILLCNLDVGSVGWTMEVANTAIFLTRDWTPSTNDQAEKRILDVSDNLRSQKRQKCIIDIVVPHSYDWYVHDAITKKKNKLDAINDFIRTLKK